MKLSQDCVRDTLLELEEKLTLTDHVYLAEFEKYDVFKKYERDVVLYSILKLIEANYINGKPQFAGDELYNLGIASITWDGHTFLDNIRDTKVWSKTKEATKNVSSISISLLSKIAHGYLKQQLGLN